MEYVSDNILDKSGFALKSRGLDVILKCKGEWL